MPVVPQLNAVSEISLDPYRGKHLLPRRNIINLTIPPQVDLLSFVTLVYQLLEPAELQQAGCFNPALPQINSDFPPQRLYARPFHL